MRTVVLSRTTRALARVITLCAAVGAAAAAAGCGGHVEQSANGIDIVVDDADGGRVTLSRKGKPIVDFAAADVGVKKVDATFDMQFGMFDIEEGPVAFTSPAKLAVTGADDAGGVRFTLKAADDTALVDGSVAAADGGVRVELSASGGNDDIIVKSACTMKHAVGLGAQTHDVDHMGQNVPLWVSEQGIGTSDTDDLPTLWQVLGRRHTSYAPIPAFVSDVGAFVLDTPAFSRIDLCAADKDVVSFEVWDETWALDVFAGETPRAAQAAMVDHLGRPPAPPPWTFAPWNDAIFGSDNVRAIAQALRDAHIPSSVLWTEDWRGGSDAGGGLYRLDEDWGVDPVLYPDFDAMVQDVNALGFQQMVYFNTFVTQGADIFDDVESGGLAIGHALFPGADKDFSPTTLLDLTKPAAVDFMKEHLEDALARGVRGWMADFGEWLPVDDTTLASGEDPHLAHNRYPVLWQQMNHDVLAGAGVLDDAVVFERSAHLGSQPLAQVIWAGDQRTSFDADDGLPTIIPIGVGLSAVGFPFVTHDVAGYQSATNDPVDKELFLRWTELGAFTSVMRTHHGTHATANVNIFTDDDTIAHWKRYADLHIRLYPYLRKLSLDATKKGGLPLWVPLPLLFPKDDAVWPVKDEVMLGPSLLVAPVVQKGATARDVTFPSARFAPFDPDLADSPFDVVDGPATVNVSAPLTEIPVYVVAGGIVPMTAEPVDTLVPHAARSTSGAFAGDLKGLEDTEGDRVVVVGLGHDGAFTEEDGTSYTLEGAGTALGSVDAAGAVVTGDGVVSGDGFAFTIAGAPDTRSTRVIFR